MRKITVSILIFLLLIVSASAQINHYYEIDVGYQRGDISYKSISVKPSQEELKTPEGTYITEVVSFDNQILNVTFFDIPTFILIDYTNPETGEVDGGGMIELNESEVVLYVPYYENAQEINIYDWDLNKKLTINVGSYAKEIVDIKEIKETEGLDEKEVSPSREIEGEKSIKKVLFAFFVGVGGVILLIIILIRLRKKKST
ncbi:hypothetical protein HOL21_04565 [Candidatus Woesearchaeota archaeon]|jgi:hypothetical protein|nr:hypothetical protein [Candidatus Woesearchaeota archaeon]MBT5397461.1 hypothetical protein [Candidatus Woesearchaeota archaeon]MBT6367966.1 hypothetical protein [Candidatus Woesearchaeota archaeon]MBT7763190.1 hypothetical protein [Candidatus Woesearchaeota archaeon]